MTEFFETSARVFWRLVLLFLVVFSIVAGVLLSGKEMYSARTLLLFKLGREYIYVPDIEESGARAPDPGDLQLAVNAETQILNGTGIKVEVIDLIGPAEIYPDLQDDPDARSRALVALSDAISISLITGSYIVQLSVQHPDAQMAARIANDLVAVYLERREEIFRTEDAGFLRSQMEQVRTRIAGLEDELERMLDGSNMLSFDASGDTLVGENRKLREELLEAQIRLAALQQQEQLVDSNLDGLEPVVIDQRDFGLNPTVRNARTAVLALKAEHRALVNQFGARHPDSIALASEIEELEKLSRQEPEEVQIVTRSATNPLWLQAQTGKFALKLEAAETTARRDFLLERLEQNRQNLAETSAKSGAIGLIVERLDVQRSQYADLYASLETIETRQASNGADPNNIRIIEPATAPLSPTGAPKKVLLLIAIFFAGLVTLGYLALAVFTKEKILSADGLRARLNLPILGEIERRSLAVGT